MKALKILEETYINDENIICIRSNVSPLELFKTIEELEALQHPKSCYNCKCLRPTVTKGRCSNCVRIAVDRYKEKENL